MVAPELTAKLDDDCVRIVKPQGTSAMFDDVDDGLDEPGLERSLREGRREGRAHSFHRVRLAQPRRVRE